MRTRFKNAGFFAYEGAGRCFLGNLFFLQRQSLRYNHQFTHKRLDIDDSLAAKQTTFFVDKLCKIIIVEHGKNIRNRAGSDQPRCYSASVGRNKPFDGGIEWGDEFCFYLYTTVSLVTSKRSTKRVLEKNWCILCTCCVSVLFKMAEVRASRKTQFITCFGQVTSTTSAIWKIIW